MRRAFRFVIETNLTSLGQASPVISKRTSSKKLLPPISKYHHYENWKIIYRYDETYGRVILFDLWDMRMSDKRLLQQFKRKM